MKLFKLFDRHFGFRVLALACVLACGAALPILAFPPTPHHTLFGMVRDEMGNPITVTNAEVILETSAGVQLKATLVPNLEPGINYRLQIPMDAGLTADAYKPTALRPMVSFRMKVKIGQVSYLPMEMIGDYSKLGQPARQTRLDLTLGEDSDGDGLPDAWERMLIALAGGSLKDLQDVRPGDDSDQDGLSNLQEYLLGTYAFDPQDGFRLEITGFNEGNPLLDLLVIRGHSYSLYSSADLTAWQPLKFRIPGGDSGASALSAYSATDTRVLRVEAVFDVQTPGRPVFFKAQSR